MLLNKLFPYFLLAFWILDLEKLAGGVLAFILYKNLLSNIIELITFDSIHKTKINGVTRTMNWMVKQYEDNPFKLREAKLIQDIEI